MMHDMPDTLKCLQVPSSKNKRGFSNVFMSTLNLRKSRKGFNTSKLRFSGLP